MGACGTHMWHSHELITTLNPRIRGAKQGGGAGGGSQPPPPLNFRWVVEHLSTPLILRRFLLGGGGLAPLKLI